MRKADHNIGVVVKASKNNGRWWCSWCWRPLGECLARAKGGKCREHRIKK